MTAKRENKRIEFLEKALNQAIKVGNIYGYSFNQYVGSHWESELCSEIGNEFEEHDDCLELSEYLQEKGQ